MNNNNQKFNNISKFNASLNKTSYEKPSLLRHGSISNLTLGGANGMNDPSGPSSGKA